VGEGGAVHPLRAEHVRVVDVGELLRGERLRGAEDHVAGVVHDHVEACTLADDLRDRGVGRLLRADVEFDGPQVVRALPGELLEPGVGVGVAAGGLPDAGVHGVPGASEGARSARRSRWTRR